MSDSNDKEWRSATRPEALGLHHIRLPVSDVWRSRAWYVDVLGFEEMLIEEEENEVIGCALMHSSGLVVGLHRDPSRAASLSGFAPVALIVDDERALEEWSKWCDGTGVAHGQLTRTELGSFVDVYDPDGIIVRLHTLEQPSTDEV